MRKTEIPYYQQELSVKIKSRVNCQMCKKKLMKRRKFMKTTESCSIDQRLSTADHDSRIRLFLNITNGS